MTPKESLLNDLDCIVNEYTASRQETRRMLNRYAVGKWVPVSERLPEFDRNGRWAGCFQSDTNTYFGVFTCHVFQPGYHWLELDIPEVES